MAEVEIPKTLTLAEQYVLEKEEKLDVGSKPVEVTKVETPVDPAPVEEVKEKTEENPAAAVDSSEVATPAAEESGEASPATSVESNEATATEESPKTATEDSSETTEQEASGDQDAEETPEIKLETAPADFRFPTTNQTRHCFTRYVEFHRCIAAKGEGASECDKFAKYYRALCPGEWVDRWNEQRENGTFPGPL